VNTNVIDASWQALVDAYEFHLIHVEESRGITPGTRRWPWVEIWRRPARGRGFGLASLLTCKSPPSSDNRPAMPERAEATDMPLPDVPFPRHIAIIMDGNGRWAVRRGLERVRGHQEGAGTVRDVVTECARLRKHRGGPDFLTLYSFSLENWKRPATK
jgi:hypothetical protein